MNFLITNMTGCRNKGCEAITKGIINGIVELEDNAQFNILTDDPDYDVLCGFEKERVSFLKNPFAALGISKNVYFFPSCRFYRLTSRLGISPAITRCIKTFQQSDAVLAMDDNFSSSYGIKGLQGHLAQVKAAACFGKPTVLVGCSIGPFETRGEYEAFTKTMRHVQLVTARESLSLKYLEGMKLKDTRIELTADASFCLEPDMQQIEKIYASYKIPREKPLVGIVPSQAIAYFASTSYENNFYALKQLIIFLTQQLGCHVILIPHVHEKDATGDDRIICELLYRNIGFPDNVTVASLDHSAEEIRALVSKFDLMITERMHAAIASLSQNVPTFVVGYSVKSEGILGDIFGSGSLRDYLISVKEIDEARLKERVKNLFDKREEVAAFLSKVMPGVKEKARRNFTLAMEVLKQETK